MEKNYWSVLIVVLIIVTGISLQTLVTTPRLWVDEGKTVELARNFLEHGTLNVQTAPGEFYAHAPSLQSTGYTVSLPLALFFKLFGLGPEQARIFMLIWLIGALIAVFVVARKVFDSPALAISSLLFIASFASLYDSGRTVVGEIPGFLFLLIGLYFWLCRENYYALGAWWGLAVVTKPSVFGLLIPTIVIVLLLKRSQPPIPDTGPRKDGALSIPSSEAGGDDALSFLGIYWLRLRGLFKVALAMLPSAVLWFAFVVQAWPGRALGEIANFYQNPYSSPIWDNVFRNLLRAPFQSTFIYFGILFLAILLARYILRQENADIKIFYNFTIAYSILAFIYYLRSPGWIRYFLIAELLILFLLPHALSTIFKNRKIFTLAIVALTTFQTIQLFTMADIYPSRSAPDTISYINNNYPTSSVAVYQVIEISSFLQTKERYNLLTLTGMPEIGQDPLLAGARPELVVYRDGKISAETQEIIAENYDHLNQFGEFAIYKLRD